MDLMWFLLGFVSAFVCMGIYHLIVRCKISWKSLVPAASGVSLLLFAVAWSVSSVLEKEPQAASMGMIVFGIPGIILMLIAWRVFNSETKRV